MMWGAMVLIDGQRLYRVDVEERRSSTFYILANSQAEAEADAKVLGGELDEWDEIEEIDITTVPATDEPDGDHQEVWVGGETGQWRGWGELNG